MKRHPPAFDEQQGVAGSEVTQVDRADIAANIVLGGCVLLIEGDGAGLGNRPEYFVTGGRAGILDILFIDHRDRKNVVDFRPLDAGADDDHFGAFRVRLGCRGGAGLGGARFRGAGLRGGDRLVLSRSRCRGEQAGAAQQRQPGELGDWHRDDPPHHFFLFIRVSIQAASRSGHWLSVWSGVPRPQPWPPSAKMCSSTLAPAFLRAWNSARL